MYLQNKYSYLQTLISYVLQESKLKIIEPVTVTLISGDKEETEPQITGIPKYEVMFPILDIYGYDLVLKKGNQLRYLQLKGIGSKAETISWNINKEFLRQEESSVVLVLIDDEGKWLSEGTYRILEKEKGFSVDRLPEATKRSLGKYVKVKKAHFSIPMSAQGLLHALFK